jgi:predicted NACHT family NTPase
MERMGRSLQASAVGLVKANKAVLQFARKADLAAELAISRSTIQKFFSGKPIARENFHQICDRLGLDWRDISEQPEPISQANPNGSSAVQGQDLQTAETQDIESLVQLVRQKGQASVQAQYAMIRVLDMSHPIALTQIYTGTNILEKMSGRRRLNVDQLLEETKHGVDRLLLNPCNEERVEALEVVRQTKKLIILGRPGVGKTTFLKFLALQCSLGNFQADCVPIFISLKNFAESPEKIGLLNHINHQIEDYGVDLPQIAEQLLQHSRLLLLLDGLDEVRERDRQRVVQEVQRLAVKFPENSVIMSCRIASHDYLFEQFTEVEVAAFDDEQIQQFVWKWFGARMPTPQIAVSSASCCLEKLFLSVNLPIRELANNPLLLTLLCLVFEDRGDFPRNRYDLYREGLDILLKQWDTTRNIKRQPIDRNFTLSHRVALLSRLAWATFESGNYFFSQQDVDQQIQTYLRSQPNSALSINSETVLKSVEAHHGLLVKRARDVYSFSHLTFHEYFAARDILSVRGPDRMERLQELVQHITEPRWREVFLLTIGMSRNPNELLQLMKHQLQQFVMNDVQLQQFLSWLHDKSNSIATRYPPVVVCAFYFDLEVTRNLKRSHRLLELSRALQPNLTRSLDAELALDLALDRVLALTQYIETIDQPITTFSRVINRAIARANELQSSKTTSLSEALGYLREALAMEPSFEAWWQKSGQTWIEQLRRTIISERNIGLEWQFESLKQYYDACCLFVDCLNSLDGRDQFGSFQGDRSLFENYTMDLAK